MDSILDNQERVALTKWYIQEKQLDKALIHIKPTLDDKDVNSEAILIAARLYAQLQLFDHAQKLFEQHLSNSPEDYNIRFQLGMTHFDNGNLEEALDAWHQILSKVANHPPALFYSAIALLQQDQTEQALVNLKNIINTAQVDNLYYEKAKELVVEVEKQAPNLDKLAAKNIYETEH